MALFDESALGMYRSIQEANMLSECDLIAFASARTATGSTQLTPFILATVPCRLSIPTSRIVVEAEQQTPQADYLVYLPAGTDMTGVKRLTVRGTTKGISWVRELIISGPDQPRTFAASVQVRCTLAEDTLTPPPLVDTVTISEV